MSLFKASKIASLVVDAEQAAPASGVIHKIKKLASRLRRKPSSKAQIAPQQTPISRPSLILIRHTHFPSPGSEPMLAPSTSAEVYLATMHRFLNRQAEHKAHFDRLHYVAFAPATPHVVSPTSFAHLEQAAVYIPEVIVSSPSGHDVATFA